MVAEVQAVARSVEELGMGGKAKDERTLLAVEAELIARYGQEVGRRHNAEFARAFHGRRRPSCVMPGHEEAKAGRDVCPAKTRSSGQAGPNPENRVPRCLGRTSAGGSPRLPGA